MILAFKASENSDDKEQSLEDLIHDLGKARVSCSAEK